MSGEFAFWFPSDAEMRDGWGKAYLDLSHMLRKFDASRQPHAIELEIAERLGRWSGSLPEFCVNVLNALRYVKGTSETDRYTMGWLTQVHATIRLAHQDAGMHVRVFPTLEIAAQPAGTLLVDLQQDFLDTTTHGSTGPSPYADWMRSVRSALEHNGLARAGAEYALAADLTLEPRLAGRETAIESALQLLQQIATLLPATPDQISTLPELWLNLIPIADSAAPSMRLRIWRLGYMLVGGRDRII